MNSDHRQLAKAILRRVVFAGLVLLGAWLLLFWLRGVIPDNIIEMMNAEMAATSRKHRIPLDSRSWDWTRSLWTNEPVAELIGQRLGDTLQLIAVTEVFSFIMAAAFLLVGSLIGRAIERPGWLAKVRSILRLVLISGGVSIPFFAAATLFLVFLIPQLWTSIRPDSTQALLLSASYASFAVALLLTQAGHGEMAKRQALPKAALASHMAVYLVVRLLRLTGVVIVVSLAWFSGLGRVLDRVLNQRDFPVAFGIAWTFVVIVVLAKLAADLIELAYRRPGRTSEPADKPSPLRSAIPIGWVVFALALAGLTIVVAVIGPEFAPHGWNEIRLQNRLAPPGQGLLMGADNVGRDIFSRILYGIRLDLAATLSRALPIIAVLATGWALLGAFLRKAGKQSGETLEGMALLPVEILRAFPWLVLPLLIVSMMGPGLAQVLLAARVGALAPDGCLDP